MCRCRAGARTMSEPRFDVAAVAAQPNSHVLSTSGRTLRKAGGPYADFAVPLDRVLSNETASWAATSKAVCQIQIPENPRFIFAGSAGTCEDAIDGSLWYRTITSWTNFRLTNGMRVPEMTYEAFQPATAYDLCTCSAQNVLGSSCMACGFCGDDVSECAPTARAGRIIRLSARYLSFLIALLPVALLYAEPL